MNYSKTFGWLLLVVGLAIVIFTLYSSYNIFTGKSSIPQIFSVPAVSQNSSQNDAQAQLADMLKQQIGNMIPSDAVSKILNLTSWSILAFILIFGGTQISGLGIKLINK